MENTTYIALSKQVALAQAMNTIANNIANVNTTGYKSQHLLLTEQKMGSGHEEGPIRMVMDYAQYKDTSQGPISQTNNPLDFALSGKGYFVVQHRETGNELYTRAGNFTLDENNQLVTPAGHLVLGDGGPITIPQGTENITVDKGGAIFTEVGQIGRFQVVEFENDQKLSEAGTGLFGSDINPQAAEDTVIQQNMLEQSNVQAVVEMTQMIEVSRQYQMNQRLLQSEHERMQNAIRKLGTINA